MGKLLDPPAPLNRWASLLICKREGKIGLAVYDTDCRYLEESGSLQFVFVEKAAGPEKGLTVFGEQGHQVLGLLYIVQGHHCHLPGLAEGLGLGRTCG